VSEEALLTADSNAEGKPKHRPAGPHVRLYGKHFNLVYKLGDGPAQITDENSGWTTIDRPDDIAATKWVGSQPLKTSVPIILDGWHRKEPIRHKLNELHDLVPRSPTETSRRRRSSPRVQFPSRASASSWSRSNTAMLCAVNGGPSTPSSCFARS
jgi:hypothetical protein